MRMVPGRGPWRVVVLGAVALAAIGLPGCGAVAVPPTVAARVPRVAPTAAQGPSAPPLAVSQSVPTFAPTVTEAPSATPVPATATPNMKELFALHEAATEVAMRTEVALTGVPTPVPGPPPPYTGPTPAPNLGLGGCALANALDPRYYQGPLIT